MSRVFANGVFLLLLLTSNARAQEPVLILGDVVLRADAQEAELDVAEIRVEAIVDEDAVPACDAVEAAGNAVGGFFDLIANGLGGHRQRQVDKQALDVDIEKIESQKELTKIERELSKSPNVKRMMLQYELYFEMLKNSELRRLHLVCNLKRSEFRAIKKEADFAAYKSRLKVCQLQARAFQGRRNRGNPETYKDATTILEKAVILVAKRELEALRADAYQVEVDAYQESRRDAVVAAIAAGLDALLMFSSDQRIQVEEVLRSKWKDSWIPGVQYISNGNIQYLPDIPTQAIRGLLDEGQRDVLSGIRWQPQDMRVHMLNGGVLGVPQKQGANLEQQLKFAPETVKSVLSEKGDSE